MKRDWKPGDVAMVCNEYGVWNVAICAVEMDRGIVWRFGVSDSWATLGANARPLAVIDAQDAEQIDDLLSVMRRRGWTGLDGDACSDLRDALTEYAEPTPPKPDEPIGLGAVVEDAHGLPWVRTAHAFGRDWSRAETHTAWDRIEAVRVLSEGVTQP